MSNIQTLRPGLLVSLKTSIVGNTAYRRLTLEANHITEQGTKRARWETERVIEDPKERERASQVRSQCRGAISRVCAASTFGLLCPEDKQAELDAAVIEARRLADEFNSTAKLTRVGVYVIAGRIAPDDVEAVRAINSEVRGLMDVMEKGIERLDVKSVRDAASKAKSVGRMLSPEAASRIKLAVDIAREQARRIVKAGEEAATVIDQSVLRKLAEQRTAFLDIEETIAEVAAPIATGRAIDLEPETEKPPRRRRSSQPQLEL